jgi:enoyl-CoA hydratase/carnithine racemase
MAATGSDPGVDTAGGRLVRVSAEHGPHVAELVLTRGEALNAISLAMARELAAAATGLAADPSLRAVVLASDSARAFCVGADLKERAAASEADLARMRPVFRAAYRALLGLQVPVIAAVAGYALGGGFELALSCDLIVADDTAVLGLPEVTIGLVPGGGGTQLLQRRVGWSAAADLALTGRRVTAAEADRLRIIDRLVAAGQARSAAVDLARLIAANSPVAVRHAKRALRRGSEAPLDAALDIEDAAWWAAALSADRAEAVAAAKNNRPPAWPSDPAKPPGR